MQLEGTDMSTQTMTAEEQAIVDAACGALADVPKDVKQRVEGFAKKIDQAKGRENEAILYIGRTLKTVHDMLANHGDGTFGKWVEERCAMSRRSAERYMNAAEVFSDEGSRQAVANMTAESLYELSRDTTPEDAITEAKVRAENGERITLAKAKEIVASHSGEQDEPSDEGDEEREPDVLELSAMVDSALHRVADRWPRQKLTLLADKLESLASEIRSNGRLGFMEVGDAD